MLLAELEECVLHFIVPELGNQCFHGIDFVLIETLEGGMEYQTDVILGLPVHVLLYFGNGFPEGIEKSSLVIAHRNGSRNVGEVVVAISTEHRCNSNKAFAVAKATFGNTGAP